MSSAINPGTVHPINPLCSQSPLKPCLISQLSIAPCLFANNTVMRKVIKHTPPTPKASAEGLSLLNSFFSLSSFSFSILWNHNSLCYTGIPAELIEDSKFVPLNSDDPTFGPPVSSGFLYMYHWLLYYAQLLTI